MITVTSNANGVSIAIQKSMNAKMREINKAINNTLTKIQVEARKNASRDRAPEAVALEKAIQVDRKNKIVGVNNVQAPYAPFIEFGTLGRFRITNTGTEAIAAKYRGTPLDFEDFVKRIKNGTGLDEKAARSLAAEYARNGTTPHPFFYPAVFEVKNTFMIRELKKAVRARR